MNVADLLRLEPGEVVLGSGGYSAGADRDDIESQMREASILLRQGNAQEALDLLLPIADRGPSLREQATLRAHMAACYNALRQYDDARREALDGIQLAERVGDPDLRERLRLELALAYSASQKHQAALDQLRISQEAIEKGVIQDPIFRLKAEYHLGAELWLLGEATEATERLREAAALADEALDPEKLGLRYWRLSAACRAQGDYKSAKAFAQRSLASYEEAAQRRLMAQAHTRLGRALITNGKLDEAMGELRLARERAEQHGDMRGLAEAEAALASLFLKRNSTEEAVLSSDHAIQLTSEIDDPILQAEAQLVSAQVLEAKKDYTAAEKGFDAAIESLKETGAHMQLSEAYATFSEFLERRRQNGKALEILKLAWKTRDQATTGQ